MLKRQPDSPVRTYINHTASLPCAVGIVLWNNRRFLPGLRENLKALTFSPVKTVIYDNGSTDGCAEWVEKEWPEAHLIRSASNLGFAEGHNQLMEAAFGKFGAEAYLALNSDALLAPDFLENALPSLDPARRIGAVQPLVLRLDDSMKPTGKVDTTGIAWDAAEGLFLDRGEGEPEGPRHETPGPVFGPSGAVALYHRDYLEAAKDPGHGYYDRRFFAYYEDVDLAWRAQRKGWRAVYVPAAKAYHRRYGSGQAPAVESLLYRNRWWLHLKNTGRPPVVSAKSAAREAAAALRSLTTRRYLRQALVERFARTGEMRSAYDPGLETIDLREFPL